MTLESDFFPWPPILCSKCGGDAVVRKDKEKDRYIVGCLSCLGTVEADDMVVAVRGWNKYQMEVMQDDKNNKQKDGTT